VQSLLLATEYSLERCSGDTHAKVPHLAAEPVNRPGCEVAYRDSLSGQHSPVAQTQVCRYPRFFRTCCRDCNDTCQAPFRPVAFGLGRARQAVFHLRTRGFPTLSLFGASFRL
jgi:hypothetical protein